MTQTWSLEQKQRILDEYRQTRIAYCPVDNTPLEITDPAAEQQSRGLVFTCPTCKNAFTSSDVG